MAQSPFRELSPPGSGDDKRGVWVRIGGGEMYGYWEPASPSPDRAVFRFLNRLPVALWPRTEPTTSAESAALLPPIAATWQAVRGPIGLESITVHCPTGTGDDNGAAGARTGAATVGCSHRPGLWPCSLGLGPWPCFIVACGFLLCWSFAAETATVIAQSLGT